MERWQEGKVQSSITCAVIKENKMNWIEFTCSECGNKYTEQTGDTDERMCDECFWVGLSDFLTQRDDCLNHEDKTTDYGPPYSMANPSGEPVKGKLVYDKILHKFRRIEVEITYEGEEE
jgi:hypothetical protein